MAIRNMAIRNRDTQIKSIKNWNYITCDLNSPLADIKADICKLPFKKFEFDLIICNHVLEHIVNDDIALKNIFYYLEEKGCAILQTPYSKIIDEDYINPSVKTDKDRLNKCYWGEIEKYLIKPSESDIKYFTNSLKDYVKKINQKKHIKKLIFVTFPHKNILIPN